MLMSMCHLTRFQVKSLPSSEMLIGCVREWRKETNKRLLVRKEEDKDKELETVKDKGRSGTVISGPRA